MADEPTNTEASEEGDDAQTALSNAFMDAAAQAAVTPVIVNRFQLLDTGTPGGFRLLAIGGGGVAETRNAADHSLVERKTYHRVLGCYAINKQFATDLLLFLEKEFGITEEEKAQRRKHYSGVFQDTDNNDNG
jgi:hypothetical protein